MTNPNQNNEDQSSDSLYLDKLQFTEQDNRSFLKYFLDNFRVVILLIIAILLWGTISFNLLPLESTPEVKIPFGIVTVTLPGASPSDMEELVIKKIEPKLAGLQGLKELRSTALNSAAMITVEFRAEEDLSESIRRLRDAVEKTKSDLPADASDPTVTEISFSNTPVWTFSLSGPFDGFTLRKYADRLKEELDKLPGTNEVLINGGDTAEIAVDFDPRKLEFYGLGMDQVIGQIKASNLSLPLGTIDLGQYEYSLKVNGKLEGIREIRNLPISTLSGGVIKLGDLAVVVERAAENNVINRFSLEGEEPQSSVSINVVKKTGYSIVELIDAGKADIQKLQKSEFPAELRIETILDISERIRDDFNNLVRDAIITIILVFFVLLLFVGLKEALVAGLVIPLVFASTFGLMVLFGITLNFLSLFSLIMSLGFLVDDAIVVVQATKRYLSTGKFTPEEAILLVFRDFKTLLVTTALTTMFSFIPLLVATGIIGQFIRSIPITVSITIFSSTLIAIFINHTMGAVLERFRLTTGWFKAFLIILGISTLLSLSLWPAPPWRGVMATGASGIFPIIVTLILLFLFFYLLLRYRRGLKEKLIENERLRFIESADPEAIKARIRHHYLDPQARRTFWGKISNGLLSFEKILPSYGRLLGRVLSSAFSRTIILIIALLMFVGSLSLPALGILKSEFLAASDQNIFYVNITGAPGLLVEQTSKITAEVEKILLKEPDIKSFSEIIGASGVNTSSGGATAGASIGSAGQSNRAQFAVNLYEYSERPIQEKSYLIAARLRNQLEAVKGATIELAELKGGPPAGSDFQAQFSGKNLDQLETTVNDYKKILEQIPGVVNAKTSLNLSSGEFTFQILPEQIKSYGLTTAQVAGTLRSAISGSEVTKLLVSDEELSVRARYAPDSVKTLEQLKNITIFSQSGNPVKLSEVATIEINSALTSINRIDQKRVIMLSAAVTKPYLPGEVLQTFQNQLKLSPLPNGIEVDFGGANETNSESILSILRAMIAAFILIVSTLVIQFNSFRKAALVLITIPLAITGVFFGFTMIGLTLTFPALIGILALFGIVVKNAIILIDKINLNLKVGIPYREAIIDASKSRLEAIFLTSISTIIGMLPLTLTDETWQGLGAALIFGLSTSTILTLVVLPTSFYILFRKHEKHTLNG